jgi:hypothetical protein
MIKIMEDNKMTLIRELEDSNEGLIGILEDGKRVHLGVPRPQSCIHKVKHSLKDRVNDAEEFEEILRKSPDYVYFEHDPDGIYPFTRISDIHGFVQYTYISFDTEKQKAIERGHDSYPVERIDGTEYVKIK